ncbi:MAG: HdeD family acid-resistance protein [Anaerolineaceae bacterium]|nr:HdeD family acid-resistance protein [Anaerolineaceae bacterium]
MLTLLSRNWWLVALRGVIAILFGLLALLFPGIALSSFVLLFGAYAIIDGAAAVWTSIQHRTEQGWWLHLLEGFVSVIAGIVAFIYPGITALVLLYVIAFWAIMTGVFELLAAIRLRKEIQGEFWMGLSGIISIVFGVLLIAAPGAGILAVLTLVGVYAIAFGVFLIMLSLRLRSHGTKTPTHTMA